MEIVQEKGKLIFYRGPKFFKGFVALIIGIGLIGIDLGFLFFFVFRFLNSEVPLWASLIWFLIPAIVLLFLFLLGLWACYVGLKLLVGHETTTFTKDQISERLKLLWIKQEKEHDLKDFSHIELRLLETDDYRTGELSKIEIIPKDKKEPIEYPVHDGFENIEQYAKKISEITGLKLLKI